MQNIQRSLLLRALRFLTLFRRDEGVRARVVCRGAFFFYQKQTFDPYDTPNVLPSSGGVVDRCSL